MVGDRFTDLFEHRGDQQARGGFAMGTDDSDGKNFVAGVPCKVHREFAQGVMDIRDDALGNGCGQVLFGEDTDRTVGLSFEDFLFRRSPGIGA